MPTYEFRCPDGHTFDRFYRKISDAVSEVECPVCGKLAARQMSAGAGLLFKGSGFYLTDYGKNAHRGGGDAPKAASSDTGTAAAETKGGDAKPAEAKPAEPASKNSKGDGGGAASPPPSSSSAPGSSSTKSDT